MKTQRFQPGRIFLIGVLAACFLRLFVFDAVRISGDSMQPVLKNGRRVLVNKLAWGFRLPLTRHYIVRWAEPEAGDIAVFLHNGTFTVKRCAATAGMTLAFSDKNGYSITAGKQSIPLSKEQYGKLSVLFGPQSEHKGKLPPGTAFMLGDNGAASVDSRDYGPVYTDSFCGKVILAGK